MDYGGLVAVIDLEQVIDLTRPRNLRYKAKLRARESMKMAQEYRILSMSYALAA